MKRGPQSQRLFWITFKIDLDEVALRLKGDLDKGPERFKQ